MARPIGLSVLRPGQANRAFEVLERKFFAGAFGAVNGNGLKIFPLWRFTAARSFSGAHVACEVIRRRFRNSEDGRSASVPVEGGSEERSGRRSPSSFMVVRGRKATWRELQEDCSLEDTFRMHHELLKSKVKATLEPEAVHKEAKAKAKGGVRRVLLPLRTES